MGTRAGPDAVCWRKISCLCRKSNPFHPAPSPLLYRQINPGLILTLRMEHKLHAEFEFLTTGAVLYSRCHVVWSGRSLPTFRSEILPPSSGLKRKMGAKGENRRRDSIEATCVLILMQMRFLKLFKWTFSAVNYRTLLKETLPIKSNALFEVGAVWRPDPLVSILCCLRKRAGCIAYSAYRLLELGFKLPPLKFQA
jgi:hypothetical protein